MGHDITCYRTSGKEQESLAEAYAIHDYSDGWFERFEAYRSRIEAAYLRRSAGNPLNVIIYRALDCEDVYGGCSGTGETKTFTAQQISKAIDYVSKLHREGVGVLERSRNLADDVALMLAGKNKLPRIADGGDVTPELNFLYAVADYMEKSGQKTVDIVFG